MSVDANLNGIDIATFMAAINETGFGVRRILRKHTAGKIMDYTIPGLGISLRLKFRFKVHGIFQSRRYYFSGRKWLVTMCATHGHKSGASMLRIFDVDNIAHVIFDKNIHSDSGKQTLYDIQLYGDKEAFKDDMLFTKLVCDPDRVQERWI